MKIRSDIDLKELENFNYHYEENLFFPSYKKRIKQGNSVVHIEILVLNRTIFVNQNVDILTKQQKYIQDLKKANLIE